MISSTKLLMAFTLTGVLFFSSCSDKNTDDPKPLPEPTTQCYLKSTNETSQGTDYPIVYTYGASNRILSVNEDGYIYTLEYTGDKVTKIESNFDDLITIEYGTGTFPTKINYINDSDTAYSLYEITNGNLTKDEYYVITDGQPVLEFVTSIQYNSDGTLSTITSQSYDSDTEQFTTESTVKSITVDNYKNPYYTSNALIIISLLDDNHGQLGKGNILTAEYDYIVNPASNIINSYTYNTNGYPLTKNQKGFSDETDYVFTYNCK